MATAKQIAARKRFAEMARSGKLATLRKKATRKNPSSRKPAHEIESNVDAFELAQSRMEGYGQGVRGESKDSNPYSRNSQHWKAWRAGYSEALSEEKKARKKNPAPKKKVQTKRGGCNPEYLVQIKKGGRWITVGSHGAQSAAVDAAEALNKAGIAVPVRVDDGK